MSARIFGGRSGTADAPALPPRRAKLLGLFHQHFVTGDIYLYAALLGHDARQVDREAIGVAT